MERLNERHKAAIVNFVVALKTFWNGQPAQDISNSRALMPALEELEEAFLGEQPENTDPGPPPPLPTSRLKTAKDDV